MNRIPLFEQTLPETPVMRLRQEYAGNVIYVKRDDLLPFAFGGNKVRKAAEFYHAIVKQAPDVIMTYGSEGSNHCRVIALMAHAMGLKCHIIAAESNENHRVSANRRMVLAAGATVKTVPVSAVAETIENEKERLMQNGARVYFIPGGGHGKPGTEGYVKAYREILAQEEGLQVTFDKIVHASGTGATQAGLVCGEVLSKDANADATRILGISIARENPRGKEVVVESVREFFGGARKTDDFEKAVSFVDDYTLGGYGKTNDEVRALQRRLMTEESLPVDLTYTGKAFYGMLRYLTEHDIRNANILFLHTGGTPLFYDDLNDMINV
ncbi:MAG: pyridoxal-phosphate dependent enzyme [Lachnospiraceae bacterium]|nr:pyridoxal-phosphate dependent enzyme [Lachnospiraceae bacterium]